jgi:tetratricopeptide (TPR) repeat protein
MTGGVPVRPKFAHAYCLLADANVMLYRDTDVSSYLAAAEAAVQAAVRLAPQAGETHLSHAFLFYFGRFDFDHALEELKAAAQSLPNSVDVALISARVERRLGRWTESARHFVRASELEAEKRIDICLVDLLAKARGQSLLGVSHRPPDCLSAGKR